MNLLNIDLPIILTIFAFFRVNNGFVTRESDQNSIPQVAFKCGYSNQYLTKHGTWVTDLDRNAVCLQGKLDILKYCKKIYRSRNITNIVELFDNVLIKNWCKPEGQPCKPAFEVRPYKCIGGEFKSDIKDVPDGCRLDRSEDHRICESFDFWEKKAHENCAKAFQLSPVSVKSFNVYKPCGLDMFSAYEYVCCPIKASETSKNVIAKNQKGKTKPVDPIPDDEDESDEDDEEDEDDEDGKENEVIDEETSTIKIDASGSERRKSGEEISADQDNYLRSADLDNEPENYREALADLEREHHREFSQIIKEWTALETKYKNMANKESKQARDFKQQMTEDYQTAVTKLEQKTKEKRRRLGEIHEQRLWADFHERFRAGADNLRSWVRNYQSGSASTTGVLRAIRYAVKLAEKNRARALNRYRRLLVKDAEEAVRSRRRLLQRLLDADSAVNKTFDILKMMPNLERKLLPLALEFWQEFRENQTPGVKDDTILWLGDTENIDKLLTYYEKNPITLEDEESSGPAYGLPKAAVHKIDPVKKSSEEKSKIEHHLDNGKEKNEKISHSFFMQSKLRHDEIAPKAIFAPNSAKPRGFYLTYLIFSVGGVIVLILAIAIIGIVRRKYNWNRRHGFIEVDGCSPEERHVTSMQGSGYENPTYKYFEQRRA